MALFKIELRFDEQKANDYGYSVDSLYDLADRLVTKKGAVRVAKGVYEKLDAEDSEQTIDCMFRFLKNKYILNFCNYCHLIDGEDGDCGDIAYKFIPQRKYHPIEKNIQA